MGGLLDELRRRRVVRVAGLYATGSWLLLQVADTVLPMLEAPAWVARSLLLVLAIGFVPVLVMVWAFEWTPKGLVREAGAPRDAAADRRAGKRLDRWIMALLALALVYFAVDKFFISPAREAGQLQAARTEGRTEAIVAAYGDKSIAVLPFRDTSEKHDQGYLSDGLAEQLTRQLAQLRDLRVISRSSTFALRDANLSMADIGRKLDVRYVLEGSVARAGERIRVTVHLVETHSDTDLWSDVYDRPIDDIFAVQDQIAAGVVKQLQVKLFDGSLRPVRKTDPKAYDLVLQARHMDLQETSDYERHIDLLEQALEIDPKFVDALSALSIAYASMANFGLLQGEEGYRKSREAANRALAIDPENSQALSELADIALRHDNNLTLAAQYMQRALATGNANLNDLNIAEDVAKSLGRMQDAIAIDEYIISRDPLQSIAFSQAGIAYQQGGMLDKSINTSRTALDMEPGQPVTRFIIGSSLLLQGRGEQALAEMRKEPFEPFRLFGLAMAYHTLADRTRSDAALAETVDKYGKDAAYNIAYVHAWRGENDQAFAWLDKAMEYKDTGLPMIAVEPLFGRLHSDPRWLPLLRRLGRAPAQLAAIEFKVELPDAPPAKAAPAVPPTAAGTR